MNRKTAILGLAAALVLPGFLAWAEADLSQTNRLRIGMNLAQVAELLGAEGRIQEERTVAKATYRWADAAGSSFIARFEDGVLVQKTAFRAGQKTPPPDRPLLDKAAYDALSPGDALEPVLKAITPEGKRVSASEVPVVTYRWTGPKGNTFDAHFEEGRYRRDTGRELAARAKAKIAERKAKSPPPAPAADETPAEPPETVDVQAPPAEPAPPEQPEGAPAEQPEPEQAPVTEAQAPPDPEIEQREVEVFEPAPGPRVVIAGADRGETERIRRARLPEFAHSLRDGAYEIRIHNPTEVAVEAGLRGEKRGRDVSIAPKRFTSLRVDRGVYSLYFIYDDDPYTLYQGPVIDLDGYRLPDAELVLEGGSYTIGVLGGSGYAER